MRPPKVTQLRDAMLFSGVIFRPRNMFHPKAFWVAALVCLTLYLGGCQPKGAPLKPQPSQSSQEAAAIWSAFLKSSGSEASNGGAVKAFSLNASLNYSGPKGSNRVVVHFWGDLNYPMRLDLRSQFGGTYAYWREDIDGFTAYMPDQETAYLHKDGRLGMAAFGVSIPFSLKELGLVLNGEWAELFPETYSSARKVKEQGYSFGFLQDGKTYSLLLSPEGRPLSMTTPGPKPWTLTFSGQVEGVRQGAIPQRIKMVRQSGEKAVMFIKKLDQKQKKWAPASLELELPPETQIMILGNE